MSWRLLASLVRYDFKARFAGSALGSVWAFASPVITIGVYWFVYTVAVGGTAVDGCPYVFWLIAGILPWFFFSDGVLGAAGCFWDYRFLVLKLRFPAERLPLVRVCSAAVIHGGLLPAAYVGLCFGGIVPCIGQLWIFLWIFGGFLLIWGLGRIFALWCVRLKDVTYGLQAAMQLVFWLTPIFWSAEGLPDPLRRICDFNPIAILTEGYRRALLYGVLPERARVLAFFALVLLFQVWGMLWMKKERPVLADRL